MAPTLTPAVAPFESPEELLPPWLMGFAVIDVVGTLELADRLEVIKAVELSTGLDLVGGSGPVDEVELVEELELVDECELAGELGLVGVLDVDVDVAVREVTGGFFRNGSALFGLLESFARTTSSAGHSVSQALEEQHPRKGLSKSKHVYQSPFESRHSWSVMLAPLSFLKLEYRTSSSGQYFGRQSQRLTNRGSSSVSRVAAVGKRGLFHKLWYLGLMDSWRQQEHSMFLRRGGGRAEDLGKLLTPEPSLPGSEAQHPRNWTSQFSQTKNAPPRGHERPNTSTGLYTMSLMPTRQTNRWIGLLAAALNMSCG